MFCNWSKYGDSSLNGLWVILRTHGHTDRHTDAGDDNTRRPKLASGKKVWQTDRRTDNTTCRAAWSQLNTIGYLFYIASSFMHHFISFNLGQIWDFFVPCDLEIWRMTLKNNRAPLLCHFMFVHHFVASGEFKLELQSGTAQFVSKSTIFFSHVTLKI